MIRTILASALLAMNLAGPSLATDLSNLSDDEREAFRAEVRAYLLENPEVLMEAISVLEQRQASQQADADATLVQTNASEIFDDGYSWEGGNPEGDVTLVEFMDYRCSYCRKAYEEVEELISSDGNIRFIVKEFPILGEASELSARFAIATKLVEGDDAYKTVHDELITFRGNVTPQSLGELAKRQELDGDAILDRMMSDEVSDIISKNRSLAQRLQISGTPTFVMNQKLLRGYLPLDGMRQMVKQTRVK